RRAFDDYYKNGAKYKENPLYKEELLKTFHRAFTTAYTLGANDKTVNYGDSQSNGNRIFIANVLSFDKEKGAYIVEMRNRFKVGDELEVLSPTDSFNQRFKVTKLENMQGEEVLDAKRVQEKLYLYTNVKLNSGDILRKDN
ncbi:MAG: U32 family peptidase C-terminal domain-containing protein, partial [Clostridia bacterium]|nr:U32 family peptidase C-terminal domain-containing protein [Clostridia bacterium]